MIRHLLSLVSVLIAVLALEVSAQDAPETISVISSTFDHHGMVPEVNSAYGDNVSVDLRWANLPEGTQQLAQTSRQREVPLLAGVHRVGREEVR